MKKGPLQLPRIYIAGPMTGYEEHNFPAFKAAERFLRQYGYEVVSPRELEILETGPRKSWEYYLRRDLKELLTCNHIAVLPGWERSRGASLEVYVGWRLGFEIIEAETLGPVDVSKYDFSSIQNETNGETFVRAFTPPRMEREDPGFIPGSKDESFQQIESSIPGIVLVGKDEAKMLRNTSEQKKETILEEAQRIVGGDRAKAYGHPKTDFDRTALIWEAILGIKLNAYQVALCMIGVKMSRECNARKRDNAVDIAGYAQTLAMVNELEGLY